MFSRKIDGFSHWSSITNKRNKKWFRNEFLYEFRLDRKEKAAIRVGDMKLLYPSGRLYNITQDIGVDLFTAQIFHILSRESNPTIANVHLFLSTSSPTTSSTTLTLIITNVLTIDFAF